MKSERSFRTLIAKDRRKRKPLDSNYRETGRIWRINMRKIWRKAVRKLIVERDANKCIYCGKPCNAVDHVIPVSMGGLTILANSVCCCRSCNSKKGANLNGEYLIAGLKRLIQHGEDISWIAGLDKFKEETELKQPTKIEIYYIEKMLQDGLEPIEISQLLGIDIDTIKNFRV